MEPVATTPAAPVATPAAPTGAPAPAGGEGAPISGKPAGGAFDHIALPEVAPTQHPPLDPPLAGLTPEVKEDKGPEPTPETEGEPPAPGAPETEPKLLAGRFKTPQELETAYAESSHEGLRLHRELETYRGEVKKRDDEVADLREQLEAAKNTPAFKELTEDEINSLSTAKQFEYFAEKNARKQRQEGEKAERAKQKQQQEKERSETKAAVFARIDAMEADSENYPEFKALKPVMNEVIDMTGGVVSGYKWTPDLLYLCAQGLKTIRQVAASKKTASESAKKAADKAAADAHAAGRTGRPATRTAPPGEDPNSDEAFMRETLGAGAPKIF